MIGRYMTFYYPGIVVRKKNEISSGSDIKNNARWSKQKSG